MSGDPPIRTRRGPVADPTPQEIAERSAEIRAEWTEEEAAKRHWTKYTSGGWSCPSVSDPTSGDLHAD